MAFSRGQQPDLTEEDQLELYLLQRHLGISPSDAHTRRPAWEVDLLTAGVRLELAGPHDHTPEPSAAPAPPTILAQAHLVPQE